MDKAIEINRDPKGLLHRVKCFALDMDGTIYIGDKPIAGAQRLLNALDAQGIPYVFLTNNSSKSATAYVEKLRRIGLTTNEQVLTSGTATIDYLRREYPGKRVYLLGTEALHKEFVEAGIVLDDENPEAVVAAYDTTLDYRKLCAVCDFAREGLPYIATHPDFNCPAPTKTGAVPDLGAFMALIEAATGRKADVVIGKPNVEILRAVARHAGSAIQADIAPSEMAMVGDRLYTDVAMGVRHGLVSILVLSGETKRTDLDRSDVVPDLVFDSADELANAIEQTRILSI